MNNEPCLSFDHLSEFELFHLRLRVGCHVADHQVLPEKINIKHLTMHSKYSPLKVNQFFVELVYSVNI